MNDSIIVPIIWRMDVKYVTGSFQITGLATWTDRANSFYRVRKSTIHVGLYIVKLQYYTHFIP